ncbi:MAG: hypothetical protein JNM56_19305 [Planctomycetia bacterium]|nr:hypothetical protein [Planctomycetia bacterium]
MKTVRLALLGLALSLALVASVHAQDKEKTLKGTITCAKCDLKLEGFAKCHTVIQVKEGDKTVTYFFDDAGSKKYHKPVCTESKKGSATGTVSEKDKKQIITVTKVEFDK